ncbi:ATP-binding protein [Lichenicoccus sp.]|uniref:ATP-binding protein n=1 Tax=Lichenicoccus sp. TaxID=2781899 RepID=UPI003D10C394
MTETAASRGTARRLVRSSSFRLMLFYAALFTLSVLVLFAIIAVTADSFLTRQIDATVTNELAEIRADAAAGPRADETTRLRGVIDALTRHSPGFFYLLQDRDRRALAGNMQPIRPLPGWRTLRWSHQATPVRRGPPIQGDGVRLRDDGFLFVGISASARDDMRRSLLNAFLWSLSVIAILGLGGGLLMAMLVLRRIEAISRATRSIMAGDLSRRIPLGGSGDEFDHLCGSLNAMLERIELLVEGVRQISNDIAHDLRTPLTRLRQRLELARRRETSMAALQDTLDAAGTQVDVILATFTSLLRIAQIEARAHREGFVEVALDPLVQTLLDAYGPLADSRGQGLAADVPADLAVRGDRALLNQLLANLLENALLHTQTGSRVSISGLREAADVVLVVADDGQGIPVERRDFVLRRFARLDASRTSPGSGLGLSLVAAVAALHGATLSLADNEPGLRCILRFPDEAGTA